MMINVQQILRAEKGFTLIELLITMLISGVIMAAIYSAYLAQTKTYVAQEQVVFMQQNLRAGLNVMVNEIRMAGYDPSNASGAEILAGTNSRQLVFTQDLNEDGDTSDAGESVTFALAGVDADNNGIVDDIDIDGNEVVDAGNDLTRDNGGGAQAIATNIHAIEFYYTLDDDTQVLNPTAAQLDRIASVQVSILAVAERSDRDFSNMMVYYPGSNPDADVAGTRWGPFNDNFRRRLLTYSITCRNMGL